MHKIRAAASLSFACLVAPVFATGSVLDNPRATELLTTHGLKPMSHHVSLRGITDEIDIFAIP